MAENKTRPSRVGVAGFIAKIRDPERRKDCEKLVKLMARATGERPVMWATMIGFGKYHYRYESGHEGDSFLLGFAPRKPDLVLYIMDWRKEDHSMLAKLGRHRLGKSCLYIRRLADVDQGVLEKLISQSAAKARARPGSCS